MAESWNTVLVCEGKLPEVEARPDGVIRYGADGIGCLSKGRTGCLLEPVNLFGCVFLHEATGLISMHH